MLLDTFVFADYFPRPGGEFIIQWYRVLEVFNFTVPAKADLLIEQEDPVEGPAGTTLKPALTAEDWRQAGSSSHIAGGATLA